MYHRYIRRSPTTYRIMNRDGLYLHDVSRVPFTWSDRNAAALAFRTRAAAQRFVEEKFVSKTAASQLLGLRVV